MTRETKQSIDNPGELKEPKTVQHHRRYHSKKHIHRFIVIPIIAVIVGILAGLWFTFLYDPFPNVETQLGATFSTKYAKELGVDWRKNYIDMLDDLHIRLLRIPVYWDEIETEEGTIVLDDIQWMMDQAEKRDADVMLAVGGRVPRWPECHPPAWTANMELEDVRVKELEMIQDVVNAFKNHPALLRWQVQNEPLFTIFGECPIPSYDFLKESVQAAHDADPNHKILVTDSGELSTWLRIGAVADILGISMYRLTWNPTFGYYQYTLPPSHYATKRKYIGPLVEDVVVTELQVEPWAPALIPDTPLEVQYRSMNPKQLRTNIEFVEQTGFSEVMLWGVEWWYWLKEVKGDPNMWDAGREVFQE